MKKINLALLLVCVTTFLSANYHPKETLVIKHSYVSTPKPQKEERCGCANQKKRSVINKDRERKMVSAMHNSVKEQNAIN